MIYYLLQYAFFGLLIGSVLIIFLVLTKRLSKKFLNIVWITLIITAISFFSSVDWVQQTEMNFIKTDDKPLLLELRASDDRSYLYNATLNQEVEYRSYIVSSKYHTQEDYHVVYFEELDHYYLTIYSKEYGKVYNNRFKFGDYERDKGDLLYVINKEDGVMYPIIDYSLSGLEIDLNSFQVEEDVIIYGVYLRYETGISHYRYIITPEDISDSDYRHITWRNNDESIYIHGDLTGGSVHRHTLGDPSEIVYFKLYENLFLYIDSYDFIRVGEYDSSGGVLRFDGSEFLTGEQYVLNGYYEFANDSIYYVSNDMKLMKFDNLRWNVTIEESVTLENWKDYIPSE